MMPTCSQLVRGPDLSRQGTLSISPGLQKLLQLLAERHAEQTLDLRVLHVLAPPAEGGLQLGIVAGGGDVRREELNEIRRHS